MKRLIEIPHYLLSDRFFWDAIPAAAERQRVTRGGKEVFAVTNCPELREAAVPTKTEKHGLVFHPLKEWISSHGGQNEKTAMGNDGVSLI